MIQGILLDYGGTIDTNGKHWGEVLWNAYATNKVPVSKDAFREAYVYGEYTLARNPLVKAEHDFLDVLTIKITQQFIFLTDNGWLPSGEHVQSIQQIAADCNKVALDSIATAKPVLSYLQQKYPMVLVSNFYGNINAVLKTFGIDSYFQQVVESAVVGVRKPNAAIFSLGVTALDLPAAQCLVIGDSYSKDIAPGKTAGCQTCWLQGEGWGDDPANISQADIIIKSFSELMEIL